MKIGIIEFWNAFSLMILNSINILRKGVYIIYIYIYIGLC